MLLHVSSLFLESTLLFHTRGETSSQVNKKLDVSACLCVTGQGGERRRGCLMRDSGECFKGECCLTPVSSLFHPFPELIIHAAEKLKWHMQRIHYVSAFCFLLWPNISKFDKCCFTICSSRLKPLLIFFFLVDRSLELILLHLNRFLQVLRISFYSETILWISGLSGVCLTCWLIISRKQFYFKTDPFFHTIFFF